MKVRRNKITPYDVGNFAAILEGWSKCETSFFLKQFWVSFGMSEMQFYKRLWRAKDDIPKFDFPEIKKNLRRNRFMRNQRGTMVGSYGKSKTVDFDSEREKITGEEGSASTQEGRGV